MYPFLDLLLYLLNIYYNSENLSLKFHTQIIFLFLLYDHPLIFLAITFIAVSIALTISPKDIEGVKGLSNTCTGK